MTFWSRLAIAIVAVCAATAPPARADTVSPERWVKHMTDELLPFWTHPDALGDPVGLFPSMRCNDGTVFDDADPCPEIANVRWLRPKENFVIAISRQTYAYGVAFHMTGERKYLDLARAGVDVLMYDAIDREFGGHFEGYDQAKQAWGPGRGQLDLQKQSYALLGPAFYYYLTRDPEVLQMILETREVIFAEFYDELENAYHMRREGHGGDTTNKLVAYLDQINTFYQIMTPLLQEPDRAVWMKELANMAQIIRERFLDPTRGLFFTDLDRKTTDVGDPIPLDYGHSAKACWFLMMIGAMTGDEELIAFARTTGKAVLDASLIARLGAWRDGDGHLAGRRSSWIFAEQNQLTASLALDEPRLAKILQRTYAYWLERFVDRTHGGVYDSLGRSGAPTRRALPKHWAWKSGFHTFEHALVAYITSAGLKKQPATLYYAFGDHTPTPPPQPYFFGARQVSAEPAGDGAQAITFTDIRFPRTE